MDSPYSPPRKLSSHGLPWLVVDVQWSPFAARDYWVASTANHRCLIWNLNLRDDSANGAIEHSLQGHSRAITDMNFSAHHPDILATCAVDGYVHSWDLRRPRQPVLTFCDWFAGATQVKWNRQNSNVLASSHDGCLHIWDERKPSRPLKSITAHTSKIYGLDWNRTRDTSIVTCSLDKTIKFWDYGVSDDPERIIRTDFPVWRARHTPFGHGLLAMPQSDPGNLHLYDINRGEDEPVDHHANPVNIFIGHGSQKAREFLWRSRGSITDDGIDNREFQLVSWGEDNELRLHRVDPRVLEAVGHVKGGPAVPGLNNTRKGATYKTFRAVEDRTRRNRRSATMSDPRPGSGGAAYRKSALSIGMQTTHYPRNGAWPTWRGNSMKARTANTKTAERSLDQLGWMKGITMSKKKGRVVESPQRKDSKDSTMFGNSFHNHWEEPETLQEEILRINQQLPNVQWENVDMSALILDAALKGPWGADGETIYIKVRIDVPTAYPKSRAPRFIIEKSAMMPDANYRKLDIEVNHLAYQFAKKKQNCLEVAFSYLLGERDLSSSTNFFKNVKDLDDDLDPLADESSSEDEENDIPAGGSASMSQDLTASIELDATLAPANRLNIAPIPRLCGARWSNDGRLVCFFPSKEEKAKALLFTPTETLKERPKGEPVFAGFGRLQLETSAPRQRHLLDESSMAGENSESDDEFSSSSSDSEETYMHKISLWYMPGRRFKKTFSGSYSMRSSGAGTGVDTGTGTGTSRRRSMKPKNVVSLHDMRDLLPSKRELAQEYLIFGDGPELCEHNAEVAQRHGQHDLVHVWRYAALLLRRDIPLELLEQTSRHSSVLVVAQDLLGRSKGPRSASKNADSPGLAGKVKWGLHPLAKGFINDLFDYFEKIADIQMLAMLSCVFSDAATEDGVAYAESHISQPETPLGMKAPSFSLDYFPTDASLWHASANYKSQVNSAVSTPGTVHTPVNIVGSYASDEGYWLGDQGSNSASAEDTPPTRNTPHDSVSEVDASQSLSTSPEPRLLRRANNALAAGFASSFPRPFTSTTNTAANSPPNRKRPSPGETILANLAPGVTWGPHSILGGPTSEPASTARTSYSEEDARREDVSVLVTNSISVSLEDQTQFDDDGWMSEPLLDAAHERAYANYRYAYADILHMWGQPLARLEIMKFNVLKEDAEGEASLGCFGDGSYQSNDNLSHTTMTHHGTSSPMVLAKKDQLQSVLGSGRGLDVVGYCRVHETQLEPLGETYGQPTSGGAAGTCERCKRTQTRLFCVYCLGPIDAQYVPCLDCGCALHESCLAEWHATGETECPAGDECRCVENACNGQVERWAAMMGALRQGKTRKSSEDLDALAAAARNSGAGHDKRSSVDKNDWETVASGAHLPATDSQGKPLNMEGQLPLSAARISLGSRLRKSAGVWSSSSSLKKKSGPSGPSGLGRR